MRLSIIMQNNKRYHVIYQTNKTEEIVLLVLNGYRHAGQLITQGTINK